VAAPDPAAPDLAGAGPAAPGPAGSPARPHTPAVAWVVLALVLAFGAWARIAHADFGIPARHHASEKDKVSTSFALAQHGLHATGYSNHPYLLLYATAAAGTLSHRVFGMPMAPDTFWLAGRVTVGILGTLTILATFLLAREAARGPPPRGAERDGTRERAAVAAGLAAAAFLAAAPLHAVHSRYLKEDVVEGLFVTLACWASVRLARGGGTLDAVVAVASAALAAGSKLAGGIAFVAVLPAFALRASATPAAGRPPFGRRLLGTALLGLLAVEIVAVCLPSLFLDLGSLGADMRKEGTRAMAHGFDAPISPWRHAWGFHLERSLLPGMTAPLLALALSGWGLLLRAREPGAWTLCLLSATWYLVHEASPLKPAPDFARYMCVEVPLLAATAGAALAPFLAAVPGHGALLRAGVAAALAGAALGVAVPRTVAVVDSMVPDTRTQATLWLAEHLPQRAVVLVETHGPAPPAWFPARAWAVMGHPPAGRPYAMGFDAATGRIFPPAGGGRWIRVEYVITSSFWRDRWYEIEEAAESEEGVQAQGHYAALESRWGPPVQVFRPPAAGSFGYHNPEIRIYRNPVPLRR